MLQTHDDYLRERQARVRSWLSEGADAENVCRICAQWICDLVEDGHRPSTAGDISNLPTGLNLITRLADAGLTEFSTAFEWAIHCKVGVEPEEASFVGFALAKAAGRAYSMYCPGQLEWIAQLASTVDHQAWEVFADSAADVLRRDGRRHDNYVSFLSDIVQQAIETPDNLTESWRPHISMAPLIEEYIQAGDFQTVWQGYSLPVSFRWSSELEILRRADPSHFLKMIEILPHPALASDCLTARRLREDAEALLFLLRLTRPSFDVEGRWQRDGAVTVLLLRLVSDQLLSSKNDQEDCRAKTQSLADTVVIDGAEQIESLKEGVADYRKLVDNLLDVLLSRPDGKELGWHWLENLLRQSPKPRPANGDRMPKYRVDYLGILIHQLSSRLAPRRGQSSWISEVKPLWRQYRGVAVLSVAGFSSATGSLDVGALALELLKRGDINLLSAKEQIDLPGAPMRTIPGRVLAQIPNIACWFTRSWETIRLQREQAWRSPRAGGPGANPAEIMALWGLGIIEVFSESETKPSGPQAMWKALEVTLREARLVEPRIGRDFWTQAVARLFGLWVALFKPSSVADSDETEPDISITLGEVLLPYVEISADFMAIIVCLYQQRVGASTLDRAVGNTKHDLLRIIQRFFDVVAELNDPQRWNPQWVALVHEIQKAITLERSGNLRTPP